MFRTLVGWNMACAADFPEYYAYLRSAAFRPVPVLMLASLMPIQPAQKPFWLRAGDLLKKAGYDYVCDWGVDDLPCWMNTKYGHLIVVPYVMDMTNDSVLYAMWKYSSPEIYQRLRDSLEVFDEELKTQPRLLSLGLHPHLIGVPHRIGYLARMLDLLLNRQDTIFMTGSQVADWFIEADKVAKTK